MKTTFFGHNIISYDAKCWTDLQAGDLIFWLTDDMLRVEQIRQVVAPRNRYLGMYNDFVIHANKMMTPFTGINERECYFSSSLNDILKCCSKIKIRAVKLLDPRGNNGPKYPLQDILNDNKIITDYFKK